MYTISEFDKLCETHGERPTSPWPSSRGVRWRGGGCRLEQYFFVEVLPVTAAMTNLGLSYTSDVINFDQNWHHLYSTSAGGKDLSNDAQIRVIGRMEPEICTKMLRKLSEKLRAKFPATYYTWLLHGH